MRYASDMMPRQRRGSVIRCCVYADVAAAGAADAIAMLLTLLSLLFFATTPLRYAAPMLQRAPLLSPAVDCRHCFDYCFSLDDDAPLFRC